MSRGPRLAAALLIVNATLAVATSSWLSGPAMLGSIVAAIVDLLLAAGILHGWPWAARIAWARIALGAVLVLAFWRIAHNPLFLVSLLPMAAVALALPGRPGLPRGAGAVLVELAWVAVVLVQGYVAATGDDVVSEAIARAQHRIAPETITQVQGRRQPYQLQLPADLWHVVSPRPDDDPALDLALSYPRRRASVEVRAMHAPGAGGFDLTKLEATLVKGKSLEAEELPPGAFDRARIFRVGGTATSEPTWAGLFVRGDRAFLVTAAAPEQNFPVLSQMFRTIVHSLQYEPPPRPVPPREVVDHVRRATVLIQTARASGSGVVLGLEVGRAWIVTNAHVVKGVADGGLVLTTFTDEPEPSPHEGKLMARDEKVDLALLRVDASQPGVTRLQLREGAAPAGRSIFSFGFPLGTELAIAPYPAPTVNTGHVAAERAPEGQVAIDLALNPGNSGGPVVDASGAVVGIATTTVLDTEVSTIVPAEQVRRFLERWSWLTTRPGEPAEADIPEPIADAARRRATEATVLLPSKGGGVAGALFTPAEPLGRDLLVLAPLAAVKAMKPVEQKIPVVFWPGTDRSKTVQARILLMSDRWPLALLGVTPFAGAPEPMTLGRSEDLFETTPVDLFGLLPGESRSTELHVLRRSGSLSSRQRDATGMLWTLHVDVGVLRRLSGGPVMGADGRLLGFFLGHPDDGRNLAVALAPEPIAALLEGHVKDGLIRVASDGLGNCVLRIDGQLEDPFARVGQVGVQVQTRGESQRPGSLDLTYDPPEAFAPTSASGFAVETTIRKCPRRAVAWRLVLRSAGRDTPSETYVSSTLPTTRSLRQQMISGNAPSPSAVKAPTTWHPAKGWTPECDPDDYGTCSQRCTKDRRPGSCFLAGLYASSAEHLLSACTAGIGAACVALAEIEILTPAGRDRRAAQRLEQVDRLVNQGCASDFGSACYAAGQLSRIFWKDGRDRSLFERGCRLESGGSCVFVAHDQLGRGNKLGAIETLQRGCRNWNGDACRELAEMLDRGDGVPAQHYLALRLYQRACAAGDDSSCPRYADLQLVQRAARLLGQADFNGRSCAAGSSGCREAVGSPR